MCIFNMPQHPRILEILENFNVIKKYSMNCKEKIE